MAEQGKFAIGSRTLMSALAQAFVCGFPHDRGRSLPRESPRDVFPLAHTLDFRLGRRPQAAFIAIPTPEDF